MGLKERWEWEREGVWKMDGLVPSITEMGWRGGLEVWDRRLLSCLFEDKSERQSSEEVCIHKHKHTHICLCVCVWIHAWTHTHANTLQHKYTYYQFVHTLPIGVVVKGHGWLGAGGWLCPEWQSSACWDVWIQMQSSIKAWGRSPFFSVSLSSSFFELLTSSFFHLCCFSVLCYTCYTLSHKASYKCTPDLPVSHFSLTHLSYS